MYFSPSYSARQLAWYLTSALASALVPAPHHISPNLLFHLQELNKVHCHEASREDDLGIVVERGLFLCLHHCDSLYVVLVFQLIAPPAQREHSRLHAHSLHTKIMQ